MQYEDIKKKLSRFKSTFKYKWIEWYNRNDRIIQWNGIQMAAHRIESSLKMQN